MSIGHFFDLCAPLAALYVDRRPVLTTSDHDVDLMVSRSPHREVGARLVHAFAQGIMTVTSVPGARPDASAVLVADCRIARQVTWRREPLRCATEGGVRAWVQPHDSRNVGVIRWRAAGHASQVGIRKRTDGSRLRNPVRRMVRSAA